MVHGILKEGRSCNLPHLMTHADCSAMKDNPMMNLENLILQVYFQFTKIELSESFWHKKFHIANLQLIVRNLCTLQFNWTSKKKNTLVQELVVYRNVLWVVTSFIVPTFWTLGLPSFIPGLLVQSTFQDKCICRSVEYQKSYIYRCGRMLIEICITHGMKCSQVPKEKRQVTWLSRSQPC